MRKLFLTSTGLPKETRNYFLEMLKKDPQRVKVAFVPTAADPYENKWFIDKARDEINETGMKMEDIDLKTENKKSLLEKLSACDVIYVCGGNCFYLLDWARKSGFDEIVPELVNSGKLYVGSSAGSYLASPTIEAAGWKDGDKNRVGLKDLTALNLVPYLISCHFVEEYRPIVERESKRTKYPIVALYDTQAIIVEGDKYKVVGEGPREFFNGFKEKKDAK